VRSRFVVIVILLLVLGGWYGVLRIAADPGGDIGRYWYELFLAHVAVSYLALLACYVVLGRDRWKTRLKKAVLSVAAVLAAMLLVELPAVLGWVDYRVVLVPKMAGGPGPHNRRFDKELIAVRPAYDHFIERQPGDDVIGLAIPARPIYETEFRFDQNGFRNESDLDRATVVLLGDSFIEGYKTPQEDICSSQLARLLDTKVANLGQCGFGPPHELAALRRYGLKLSPEVVVWFFFEGNDLQNIDHYQGAVRDWEGFVRSENAYRCRSFWLGTLEIVAFRLDQLRTQESALARRRSGLLLDAQGAESEKIYFGVPPFAVSAHELDLFAKLEKILWAARGLCQRNGIRFLVVNVPTKLRVYQDLCRFPDDSDVPHWTLNDVPDRLAAWCDEAGIAYVDLTSAMKAAALTSATGRGGPVYLPDDPHWSARGHAVVAGEIARWIRAANGSRDE